MVGVMKKWELVASIDGDLVDYTCIIECETEPGFWTCTEIAEEHGCELWTIDELDPEFYDEPTDYVIAA